VSNKESTAVQSATQIQSVSSEGDCRYNYGNRVCGLSRDSHKTDDAYLGHSFIAQAASEQAVEDVPSVCVGTSSDLALAEEEIRREAQPIAVQPREVQDEEAADEQVAPYYDQVSAEAKAGLALFLKEILEHERKSSGPRDDTPSIICDRHMEVAVNIQGCIACEVERHSIDPLSLTAERCAEIITAADDWKWVTTGKHVAPVASNNEVKVPFKFIQIIAAWLLEHGEAKP